MANVQLKQEVILSQKRSVLKELHFDIQKKNGKWERQQREVFDHGNAVTALLYNEQTGNVVLIKQFRMASFINGNSTGMLLEACAGILEEGEEPEAAMKREIREETGFEIQALQKLFEAYSSPGAYTELVHYFLAPYTDSQKTAKGGGLEEEGEEVKVVEIPFAEACKMMQNGELKDAKTLLLLQYLQCAQK